MATQRHENFMVYLQLISRRKLATEWLFSVLCFFQGESGSCVVKSCVMWPYLSTEIYFLLSSYKSKLKFLLF